jgi:hypothetical protein
MDPRVQEQVHTVEEFVKDKAPDLAEKATSAVKKVSGTIRNSGGAKGA